MKFITDITQINKRCYALKIRKDERYRIIFAVLTKIHSVTSWKLGGTLYYTAGEFFNDVSILHGCAYVDKIQERILKEFKILKKKYEHSNRKNR